MEASGNPALKKRVKGKAEDPDKDRQIAELKKAGCHLFPSLNLNVLSNASCFEVCLVPHSYFSMVLMLIMRFNSKASQALQEQLAQLQATQGGAALAQKPTLHPPRRPQLSRKPRQRQRLRRGTLKSYRRQPRRRASEGCANASPQESYMCHWRCISNG